MPDVQPARRRPRAQVRADLLDAAERLVRTRGFRVSVDEIAAAAGMTKGAVYSNFAHRGELMEAVAERMLPTPIDVDTLVPEGLPVAEAIDRGARELVRRVDERPEDLRVVLELVAEYVRDPDLLQRVQADVRGEHRAADRLQRRADEEGRPLPRSARDLATVMDALALGLGASRLLRGADAVPEDLFAWAFGRLVAPDPP